MNRSNFLLSVTAALCCTAALASADVTLLSRHSEAWARYRDDPFVPPWLDQSWFESATNDEPGPWSLTLPHGYTHGEYASGAAIGGEFLATWMGGNPFNSPYNAEGARQRTTFRLDEPRSVTLTFNAQCRPCHTSFASSPNLQFTLTHLTSGHLFFEVFRDGETRQSRITTRAWDQQTWAATLPRGDYELRAVGDVVSFDLNAGVSFAIGDVTFSFTFGDAGCNTDFNLDGFVDFFDYAAYVACFEGGECPSGQTADFNADGFADFFDYADFVEAFEAGC